jgi:hypothetical protein
MHDMITLRELLDDPAYKAYFLKIPRLPKHYTPDSMPWKLMVLKNGEDQWRVKRFGKYSDAFAALKKLLHNDDIYDMVINCPALDFQPPIRVFKVKLKGKTDKNGQPIIQQRAEVWKPQIQADMPTHYWCPYCRRPTAFGYFTSHKSMTKQRVGNLGANVDPSVMRCYICGASEMLVNLRHPANHQNWDLNRVRVA